MQQIIVKVNNASQVVTQAQVVTKSGQPTIIKANGNANYEFVKETSGKAPDHIVTKRVGKDLHVSFEEMGQESDLIVENFYDYQESALIGQAESGEYHYYIPDTGEVVDYVTQLHPGAVEGQALGGDSLLGPWWMTALPTSGIGGGGSSIPWLLGSLGAVGAVAKGQSKDDIPRDPDAQIKITSIATNNVVENNERGTEVPVTGVVSGDFTAGDVVTVRIGKNSRDYKDYTTTVDADGNFTVNVPADELVEDGDKFVEATVKATSEMGNSYPFDKKSYGVDPLGAPSIAPAIKIALDVTPDDEYINSAEKGTATTTDVEVGVPADAKNGDVITVTDKTGTVIATYVVGKDGVVPNSTQIIKDIPLPAEGESLEFTASITNATGVIKSATDKTTLDSTPPEVTELEVSKDGTTITGKTEPNLPVEVTLPDGTKLPTVADKDGTFTVTPPAPVKPNDTVQAVATDPAGNPSQPKDAQRGNEAPTVDVTVVFIPEQGIAKEGDLMARSEGKDPEGEPVTYSITPNSDPEGFYAIDPQTGDVTLTDKGAKHVNNGDDLPPINVTVTDPHGLKGTDEEAVAPTTDLPKVEIVITSVATDDVVQLDELNAEVPVTGEVTGDFSENDPVIVTVNGVDYETTVDSMGHFSVSVPANELAKDTDGKIEATINARSPKGVSSASATHDFAVELPEVSLTGDDKVDEGQSATYTVSLNKAFAKDVTVAIEVEHIDTVTGDIVVTTQTVTVPAGNTQVKFGIDAVADKTTEGVEVYRVVMKDPQNATLGADNVATEIQDTSINGLPSVEVTVTATPTQGEAKPGDEIATSKGTDPEGEPVTYTITDGSDPEGFYAIDPVTGTVTLTPKGADHVNNGNDLPPVSVTVTDPQGKTGTDANNTVPATIDLPVVSISGADRVEEGKDATYTVSLNKASSKDVTVTVTITHGTTDAGDLVTTTQEVTIKAGTTEATFNVTAVADNTTEGDENFQVVISAPVNATLGTTSTDTTVVDASTTPAPNQAPTVEVTITAAPTQGEAKPGDEIATSKGTDPEGEPVTYTITDGSDPEGFYAIDPVTGTVTLTPKGADHVNNGNDLPPVSVTVTDPQGKTGTDANNTVPATIDLPVVSISGADRVEEGKDATYTVSLNKASSKDVTVTVTITHGTTDAGDLVTTTQEVTIKAGTTEATFNVTAVADNTTEGDENFQVVISAPVNATLGTTSTDTTVVDASTTPAPNQAPTVEVTITAAPTQGEAKPGDEIATSKGTDPEGEPVTYTITDGSDPEGFYAIDPVTGTVTLTPKGADHVNNGNDLPPVSVTVTDPQGKTGTDANNTVPATIDLPVVSISGADRVEEGKDATYTVSLNKASSKDVTVTVTITHGTTDAGDLVTTTQEVTIKAGTTEATFNVTAVADNTTEGDENFQVVISAPVNATLGTTSTDTTVVDASTTPAPNQAPTVEVTITAAPTQGEAKPGDEIATSKGTDPEGEPVTYTITDGSDPEGFYAIDPVTGTVTLTPKGADHVNNGNDLPPVSVTVTDPQGKTGTDANNTVPATIDLPVVSISGADRVEEGKDATYTVSLNKASSKDVTVTVTITHGTTDAGDLVTTTQEVTIKAGTTEATFNVTAVADNTTEGDENFQVVISAPVNATLGTTSTDTTVVDASTTPAPNQAPTVEVTITAAPTQGEAKPGDEIATSKGTDPEGEPVTYTITDGSDPEGFYAIDPVTGTVTLTPKGADHVNNGNDLPPVSVTVTDPQGKTGTDANNTVPATIDLPVVSISGADRVEEGKDATYTVSLNKASSKDVTVTVTITHGTTDAGDLVTTTQEVTIKAGTTEATFNVTAVADNTTEGDENFQVVISAPVNATLGTTSTDTTVVDASTTPAPNQAPTVEVTITAAPTQGEAKPGDEIATSKGTDPEGEPVTYTITDGSDPEGFYAIDPVTGTVTLTPKGADHVNNGNDLPPVSVTVTDPQGKTGTDANNTVPATIDLPVVSISGADRVEEGKDATYTVSLNKASSKDVTVTVTITHGTTDAGDLVTTTQEVTIKAGTTEATFNVTAVADNTTEGDENFQVVISAPVNATLGTTSTDTTVVDASTTPAPNQAPTVEVTITAAPTQGEAKPGDEIATSKGTDPEGEPVTYTITDGSDPEGFYAIDPVTGTVTLTPKGADHVNNGNDLPPVSVTVTDPQGKTGTDANNTVPATIDLPVVSISGADRVEEGKDATYTVSLNKASSKDVTVTVTITHGTTDAGDLVTTTQEVTIKAGTTEATFNVTAVADNTTEGDENFQVVISAPVNATLGTTSTDTTVVDASTTPAPNQAPTVEVTITAAPTQGEAKPGDEIATSKGTDPEGEPVTYTITDGSDPEGFYAIDPVTGTVTLTPKGADHVNNGNDLPPVSVTVTDPQGKTGTDANNTVPATIDLPVVSISGADRVEEGKDATYTVSLNKASSKDVTVTVTITHGTTDAGDLVTTTQEVTIKAGTTEATFNVTAVADNTTEGDENFQVVISAPVNATLGTTSTDTTVVDASTTPAPNQAPTVEVTITAAPTQGEAKPGDEIATSKGTDPEGEPVTYTITDGSDPEGFYAIDPVTGTVTLTPKGADHVNNGNDLPPVSVTVTDPQGKTGTDANNTVPATIDLPVVSISGADRVEEGKDATYTVSLNKASSKDVTVTVTITHGTTDAGDLVTTTQEVTIKAGTTEATFNVTAVADNTTEGDENFQVVISAPVNATLGTTSTDTTVVDASTTPAPNQAPTVEVTITAAPTQGEAKPGDEIATSKGTDPEGEPVTYTITDGSDPEGFYAIDPVTGTVTLTPKGADHVNNGNDLPPVSVTVTDPQGKTGTDANNTVPATIDLPVVSISGADRVEEGKDATYTVSLNKASSKDVTVTVTITHGTTDAGDLVTTTQEVTIKAGTTEATFNVTAVADNTTEGDENFQVVISAPVNATLGTTSTDTTVVDASTTPAPNQAPTVEVTITAAPTQGEAKPGDEIATSKGTDPEGEPVTYTITDGSDPEGFYAIDPVTGTVTLTPKGADHVNNGNDLPPVSVTVTDPQGKTGTDANNTVPATIDLPVVSISGADRVEEGKDATYTVSLNKASSKDVTVTVTITHGTTDAGDLVTTTQEVTIKAGTTEATFNVTAVADNTTEGDENFQVVISAPVNATLGTTSTDTTVVDASTTPAPNQAPTVEVTITAAPTQGEAKPGDEIATSKGTDPEGEPVTYTITDGSDPEGFYAIDPVTGTVTLTPKGADHVNNGNDLPPVSVTVTDPQGKTGTDANNTVPATIDLPVVSISGADRVEEGKDATYTVSLNKASSKDVTVTVTITHGTTDAGDLVTTTQEVTIKAGTTEATFNVTAVADNTTEGDENFQVVISAPVNATLGTTSTDTTVVDASTTPAPNQAPTVEVTITAAPTQGEAKPGDEIATSKGTDPEGEPVTYTITDGSDPEGFYAIDPVTGTVTLTPKGADHVNNGNDLPPVSVTVTDPQGKTGTDANNTVPATIDLPVVSISGADRVEEGKDATYTVSLNKASSKDVTVTVTITHGTTDAGDLVTTTQEVTIKAGTTEATFNVTAVADNTTEGDENFQVVISAPVNATLGTTSTDTTVVDASTTPAPNQAPTVEVTITAAPTQGEAKPGDEIATSKGTDPEGEPVTYTITDGSDPEGFYAIDPVTGTVTLTPKGADHVNNGNDLPPVSVTVTDPQGKTGTDANNTVPATIDLPVVSISGADRVEEGKDATYTVSLNKASSKDVTVTVTITHGTTDAGDLVTTTQEVTIKAGTTEATFNVTAVADNTTEGDENFQVVISAPVNATLGTTSTDTTVVDASTTPAPNQAPTVEVTITAAPTQGEAKPGDEIATSKGTDPEGEPVTYTITDGSDPEGFYAIDPVTGTVTLTPKGADHVNNGNDLPPVSVTVTDPQGKTGTDANNTVPATIDLPVVSISGADRVEEGKDATYTVSLNKASSKDVTVTVTITHGTTDAGDLVTTTQEVTIKAGTTEATFNVTAVADNTTEGDENFQVVISAPVNATLGTTSTDTTVVDASTTPAPNQAPTVEVTITAAPTQGEAKPGDEIATSKGTDPEGEPVTYTITDGSDPEGFYAIDPVTGTVTLTPKGADHVNNGNDLPPVSVTVTDPQGKTGTDANNTVPATIDLPVVSISGADRVEEGKDATYTVSLNKASSKDVTVTVTITHGTTDAGDLVTTTQEVTIKAGTTEATFNVTAVADNTTEGDENFQVVISAPVNATLGTTSTDTTVVDASTTPAPQTAPVVTILKDADNNGYINAEEKGSDATTDVSVLIPADARNGDVVTVIDGNNVELGKYVVGQNGVTAGSTQIIKNVALPKEGETLSVKTAISNLGGKLEGNTDKAIIDTIAPDANNLSINIISIAGEDNVLNLSEVGVTDKVIPVVGQVTGDFLPGNYVTVHVNGKYETVTVDEKGMFTAYFTGVDLNADADRVVEATILARDKAGNLTKKTDTEVFTVEQPAVAPTIDSTIGLGKPLHISEEGLKNGIADYTGQPDTTNNAYVLGGQLTFTDPDSSKLTVELEGLTGIQTLDGQTIAWRWNEGTSTLQGMAGGEEIMSIYVSQPEPTSVAGKFTSDYNVVLHKPVLHPVHGIEDVLNLDFNIGVSDGKTTTMSKFTVVVEDDMPSIAKDAVVDITLAKEPTQTNLLVGFDLSSSMTRKYDGSTYLDLAKQALKQVIDKYDADSNEVMVKMVTFGTNATVRGSTWMTVAEVKQLVDSLVAFPPEYLLPHQTGLGATNYEDAIVKMISAFGQPGKLVGNNVQNVSVFLTDGEPNYGNGNDSTLTGITSRAEPLLSATEEKIWTDWLSANNIKSHAYAMQTSFEGGIQYAINPIAYDGTNKTDMDGVHDREPSKLAETMTTNGDLTFNIVESATGTGSVFIEDNGITGKLQAGFGADGGYVSKVVIGGQTYTFDGANAITTPTGKVSGSSVTITTPQGGKLVLDMATAVYHYTSANGKDAYQEQMTYTVVDRDGDGVESKQTWNVVVKDANGNISLNGKATLEVIDDGALGLNAEYYGYNDSKVAGNKVHADDTKFGNLQTISDMEGIINGRNGKDVVGTNIATDQGAADARFTATSINYGNIDTRSLGTNIDVAAGGDASVLNTANSALYQFLSQSTNADKDSIVSEAGIGKTTDAAIRVTGNVYFEAGHYDFRVYSDDGFRLLLDGQSVIEFNNNRAPSYSTKNGVYIEGGLLPVELLYWEQGQRGELKFEYKSSTSNEWKILDLSDTLMLRDNALDLNMLQDIVQVGGEWNIRTGDVIEGGSHKETITGSDAKDLIYGGGNNDTLTGGNGGDFFVYNAKSGNGNDVITDFQVGADKIVLSDVIDVNANNLGINLDNPAWAGKADVTNMAWNDATKTLSFNTQDGATNSVTFENMTESYANLDAFLKANSIL